MKSRWKRKEARDRPKIPSKRKRRDERVEISKNLGVCGELDFRWICIVVVRKCGVMGPRREESWGGLERRSREVDQERAGERDLPGAGQRRRMRKGARVRGRPRTKSLASAEVYSVG